MDRRSRKQYRSPNLPDGYFSQVGSLHMHIDGAGESDSITELLKGLQVGQGRSKLNLVLDAVGGPQRNDFRETYASHTPRKNIDRGRGADEEFDYFSTIHLANREEAIGAIRQTLAAIGDSEGIVIEVEHVVAKIDTGKWAAIPVDKVLPIQSSEVGFKHAITLPFEIHHALDISSDTPPFNLTELMNESSELGMRVGGWFSFMKEGRWAYRSNAFSEAAGLKGYVRRNHDLLDQYLTQRRISYRLWTLVERVIGVWRTPVDPV